jgi:hypothetical protein
MIINKIEQKIDEALGLEIAAQKAVPDLGTNVLGGNV